MTTPSMPITGRGLTLCGDFYRQAVQPILQRHFPALRHAAALIGSGSEVLGFDDEMSTDHHWGPRVMLFVEEATHEKVAAPIHQALAAELPYHFGGYSTSFSPPNPNDNGTQLLQNVESGPVNHRVTVQTLSLFSLEHLGFDLLTTPSAADWLSFPQQKLRTMTAGAVFHDDIGLEDVRARFAYYPHDVWLYQLASVWERIGEEEHLMGRAGHAGDDLGSRLIAGRLVRDAMMAAFLMERTYAPYAKWWGTAFALLQSAPLLSPYLAAVLAAESWQERGDALAATYEMLASMHNTLGVTEDLPTDSHAFFGRPFTVIGGQRFADALLRQIVDPAVRRIAARRRIGGIDIFSDSTSLREEPARRRAVAALYGSAEL